MYQMPDTAIEAILREWDLQEYDPPNSDIREWIRTIEQLCDTYGIPDTQRPQCATRFVKGELRAQLESVLKGGRTQFGPILWAQFANFMVSLDHKLQEWEELSFYKKYPNRLAGAALFLTGTALLAPAAISGALTAVGFTTTGVAAGRVTATVRSIRTIVASVATGAGIGMMGDDESIISKILSDLIACGPQPCVVNSGDEDADPPPYSQANPSEYLLTPLALQAIAESWDIAPYDPLEKNVPHWLNKLRKFCELYGVPVTQRTQCAMHHMGTDRERAHAVGCHNMTWDQYTMWLLKHDEIARFLRTFQSIYV